jgi:hypothetical protein
MKRGIVVSFVLASLLAFLAHGAAAASLGSPGLPTSPSSSPRYLLKFAGSLREPDGTPSSGLRDVVFEIHRGERGAQPIWSERRQVESRDGNYSALLGMVEHLTAPPGEGYVLAVRLEGSSEPFEEQAVSIVVPAGRNGPVRQAGTPVYRLAPAPERKGASEGKRALVGKGREGAGGVAAVSADLSTYSVPAAEAAASSATSSAPKLILVGVEVAETSGNTDGMLEPGETVNLKVKLFNDGAGPATSVFGTLDYLGTNPDVFLIDKTATWPDLAARGAPALTSPPHFQVQVASTLACGAVLPFRLEVTTGTGQLFDLDFSLKVGQRADYDMLNDTLRRYNEQEASFWGADSLDLMGYRVGWGDVNGDGRADVILGAALGDSTGNTRTDAGEVYLIYGKSAQWSDADLRSPPSSVARFWGADPGDLLGTSIASGDVNADGFDDLILGARTGDSTGNTRPDAGEVYLIYGKSAQWTDTDLRSPPSGVARLWGADSDDQLGNSVASGDVNGDGFDDLILGANQGASTGNTRNVAGEVYLIYGKSTQWTDTDLFSPPPGVARFWGASSPDKLGSSAASGDVNADGFDDLILGASEATSTGNTRNAAGEVYLIYGKSAQWTDTDLFSPPPGVARFWGADPVDLLGLTVASGDVNADGFDDLILGEERGDSTGNTRTDAGEVYLIYGKSAQWTDTDLFSPPSGVARFWGADPFDHLGTSVASGDVNGDGFDDLILGAQYGHSTGNTRYEAGEVYVIYGKSGPWTDTDLVSPPAGVALFWGADPGDHLGFSAASGDVNGDGFDDLILGADAGDSTGNTRGDAGEVYLWYGKPADTYYARSDTYAFIDASVGTELTALSCDDCSTGAPIGFSFPFYGEEFSTVYVSSNGVISFAPISDLASANPICLPSRNPSNLLVAPFWDDLIPSAGGAGSGVFTLLQGTAPNRRLTIEWKGVPHYPSTGAATFEVTLFESTGQILTQYADTDFGSGAFDAGAAAVLGVENRTGAHGSAYSCFTWYLLGSSTAVRFVPTTSLIETRTEGDTALWSATGLWHSSNGTCEPDQHAGSTSWYYGQESVCNYETGSSNSGVLAVPTIPDFPADARMSYWYRRQAEGGPFDVTKVGMSTTGTSGAYSDVEQLVDPPNLWQPSGVINLFSTPGATVDLRFSFDTVDASFNDTLGWMVDDIQVVGCDATGAPSIAASATAYAQPDTYCQGSSGMLDALGSFCGDSGQPSGYQWKRDAQSLAGETSLAHTIPPTEPAGVHDYSVVIACPGGAMDESDAQRVTIVAPPQTVGPTLDVVTQNNRADLHFTWTDVAGADDYVVFQDTVKNGSFTTVTGTASNGAAGLTVPTPAGSIVYFLVAGRNAICGEGQKR